MRENRHPTLKNPTSSSYGFRSSTQTIVPTQQTLGAFT